MAASKALANPFEKGEETPDTEETSESTEGGVVVPLRGPDDEDDEDEGESTSAPERTETSRDRRRNRYKEQKEGRERAERERDEYQARVREYEARQAYPQAPQGPPPAPLDEQYREAKKKIYDEKRKLAAQYNAAVSKGIDKDLEDMFWQKSQDLDTQNNRLDHEYSRLSNPANRPGAQMSHEQQTTATWLRMNHSDVINHPNAQAIGMFAAAEEVRLVANGAPKDFATAEKAMQAAKLHFGLVKRPAPSPRARAAYSGGSSSAGVGGGAANGGAHTSMTLTKNHQEMAEARFPDLKPADAHRKWANGVGRKVLENREARRRA